MPNETVLVTGASSGIGLELARLFARDGADLVIVARRKEKLEQVAKELRENCGVAVKIVDKDLSLQKSPQEIYDQLEKEMVKVDVLVNNAGFGAVGSFSELDHKRQMDMLNLNINALTSLTRLFLPKMIERNYGGILNVGSLAGFQPGPYGAVYYATKSFVLSFTEAIAKEVEDTSVKVSCLAPGPTRTEFGEVSGIDNSLLFRIGTMNAREVAQAGYEGFRKGKFVVIPGVLNNLVPFMVRLFPRSLIRAVSSRLNRP